MRLWTVTWTPCRNWGRGTRLLRKCTYTWTLLWMKSRLSRSESSILSGELPNAQESLNSSSKQQLELRREWNGTEKAAQLAARPPARATKNFAYRVERSSGKVLRNFCVPGASENGLLAA